SGNALISFNIAKPTQASLRIYDASGRIIRTLVNGHYNTGTYNLTWNGRDDNNRKVAEGVYFYTLETENHTSTKKLVLTR
ncbi:MAG: T9SS type A sorting domain-containing protein, partial [Candidatus Latescibacteria bacterium]|nr:T9SS type A sorting domain-containing protein [Candidatus Latescibacterota bacterium]